MTDSMVKQKNMINSHLKEIKQKKDVVKEILEGVDEVEVEVDQIKENEQAFLKQQMEEYYLEQEQNNEL